MLNTFPVSVQQIRHCPSLSFFFHIPISNLSICHWTCTFMLSKLRACMSFPTIIIKPSLDLSNNWLSQQLTDLKMESLWSRQYFRLWPSLFPPRGFHQTSLAPVGAACFLATAALLFMLFSLCPSGLEPLLPPPMVHRLHFSSLCPLLTRSKVRKGRFAIACGLRT